MKQAERTIRRKEKEGNIVEMRHGIFRNIACFFLENFSGRNVQKSYNFLNIVEIYCI